jgi:hypothetical protein
MFIDMTGIATAAFAAAESFKQSEKLFEKSIERLSDSEKISAREKRRLELREERMHSELCRAIRDSKKA